LSGSMEASESNPAHAPRVRSNPSILSNQLADTCGTREGGRRRQTFRDEGIAAASGDSETSRRPFSLKWVRCLRSMVERYRQSDGDRATNPPSGFGPKLPRAAYSGERPVRFVQRLPDSGACTLATGATGGGHLRGLGERSRAVKSSTRKGAQALSGQSTERRSRAAKSHELWVGESFCRLLPEILPGDCNIAEQGNCAVPGGRTWAQGPEG
jgi:hypothetical protein